MQIKAKIACAGDEALSQYPGLPCDIEELGDGRGGIDDSKLRASLVNEQINIGSRDKKSALVFGAEMLHRITKRLAKITDVINEAGSGDASLTEVVKDAPVNGKSERNLRKGRYVFCKTVITGCLDGIHVRISVENPKNVCGNAITFAYEYAMLTAQSVIAIENEIKGLNVTMNDGEGAEGLFDESRRVLEEDAEVRRRYDLRVFRDNCARRRVDLCSPSCFECELYNDGRCDSTRCE